MKQQVLFIQGGGDGGYKADELLVFSLQKELGKGYQVNYPELQSDDSLSDFGWLAEIEKYISGIEDNFILVGHSLGASMTLKYLSEKHISKTIKGIFLIATPFWRGAEEWKAGLKLTGNFADKLPADTPIFFYHCKDDDVIPLSDFQQFRKIIARGNFREIEKGGHQVSNDLALIANDIKFL